MIHADAESMAKCGGKSIKHGKKKHKSMEKHGHPKTKSMDTHGKAWKAWTPILLSSKPKGGRKTLDTQSAGINRHEAENGRVLQERSSEPS